MGWSRQRSTFHLMGRAPDDDGLGANPLAVARAAGITRALPVDAGDVDEPGTVGATTAASIAAENRPNEWTWHA